jgi:hypothetical protein
MGDAFSLCKSIHVKNIKQNLYEQNEVTGKDNSFTKFRISELPFNITPIDQQKEKSQSKKLLAMIKLIMFHLSKLKLK